MTANPAIPFDALREIRDRALLMSLGSAYLCEQVFLTKCGAELEHAVELLDRDIRTLKKRFPGRFTREVDTNAVLEGLRELSGRLKASDREVQAQCTVGELGRDLEERLKILSDAVRDVRRQVEGGPAEYTGKEAVAGAVVRAGETVRGGLAVLGRMLGVAVVLLAVVFGYLFFTMEREGRFETEISRHRQEIQALQKELAGVRQDKIAPLEFRIRQQEREGYSRRDKVRVMELSVELEALEQEALALQGRIEQQRRRLEEAERSLETLKQKGFWERLLRR